MDSSRASGEGREVSWLDFKKTGTGARVGCLAFDGKFDAFVRDQSRPFARFEQ
jgi:hypothetical protein